MRKFPVPFYNIPVSIHDYETALTYQGWGLIRCENKPAQASTFFGSLGNLPYLRGIRVSAHLSTNVLSAYDGTNIKYTSLT